MAIADRRKREREQRRSEIIDAAQNLFFAKGYDNVTMDEIANEAEVNKALLYYYFKNKEALFFAVYLRIVRMLHKMYVKCSKFDIGGLDKLKAMSQVHEFSKDYPDHFSLYIYARSERFRNTDNEDAKKATELGTEIWQLIAEAFLQGIEEGTIRNDLDPVEMSIYLTVISMGVLNIDPEFKTVLEAKGISLGKFWNDLGRFMLPAITNRPCSDLEFNEGNSNGKK